MYVVNWLSCSIQIDFFLRMKETEFVSRVDVFGNRAQATQNNRVCPLMRIELLLRDRQPHNLNFLISIEGRMYYNSYYMKGATINPYKRNKGSCVI